MTLQAEHFIYGMFKGHGIKLIKSSGLKQLLDGEIINILCQLHEKREYTNLWPNGVLTVTKISGTQDEYGRNGVWNHTIALRLMDYLAVRQPSNLLQPHFITGLDKPPRKLESLTVKGMK